MIVFARSVNAWDRKDYERRIDESELEKPVLRNLAVTAPVPETLSCDEAP